MNALRIAVGVVAAMVAVGCSPAQPTCTAGQVLKNGACVAEVTCGAGTTAVNGACVADLTCAAGTRAMNGMCVPDVVCGAGTTAMNGTCVPDLVCGAGTRPMNGMCAPICANGTMTTDGGCVPDVVCGTGTTAMNGMCVPNVTCGTGTVAAGGTCVPDGTVVCTQGTRFDMASGTCVVDPTACANGTTLVGTVCTPDDELLMGAADLVEVEVTDGGAISGTLPTAMLDAGVTFYGCVTPPAPTVADEDLWLVTVTEPTLLDVRVDGIGGLSGAFGIFPASSIPALATFQRIGINLAGDTSQREVYLPLAGTYAIRVDDSRALFSANPVGDANTCYFATVRSKPMPAAQPAMTISQQLTDDGHVRVLSITAGTTGELHDVIASSPSSGLLTPAFVLLKNGTFARSVRADESGLGEPAHAAVGGLNIGGVTTIVLDAVWNFGLAPVDFTLDPAVITSQALPTSGGNVAFTHLDAGSATPWRNYRYFYFDVAAPGVVNFNVAGSVPLDMVLARADAILPTNAIDALAVIDAFGGSGRASFLNEPVRFLTAGRYYFVVYNPATTADGTPHTLTGSLTNLSTDPVTFGTAMPNVALPPTGAAFLSLDLTNPVWVEYGITATTNWGANPVAFSVYPATAEGWLRTGTGTGVGNVFPQFFSNFLATGGNRGRIHFGETNDDFVVRVSGASGASIDFSLLIRNRPNVVDLGLIPVGAPVVSNQTALTNGTPLRFFARGRPGDTMRAVVTPLNAMSDLRVDRFDANENSTAFFDASALGGAETLVGAVGAAPSWVAWSVSNKTVGVPTDFSASVTSTPPRPYVITTGTLPFVDACTGTGSSTLGTGQDDGIFTGQTLPMPFAMFRFFGDVPPATFRVGANGWMSFDTGSVSFGAFSNQAIPGAAAPNGVIAPYWDDQDASTMCRKNDPGGTLVTFQWTAQLYQQPGRNVQYQVVLHADGVIDFIYGPNHLETGGSATVGLEDINGLFGHQVVFNQAGTIAPNTSRTFTPM